jgi:DNA-binding response OmpR family regulator
MAKEKRASILIIEDEPKVAGFIKKGLEECGYKTAIAIDGNEGKTKALSEQFDLIILDINLPIINGFQLCSIIRENDTVVPILMLTALGSIEEKMKGFDSGADDYLLKPFEFEELTARIKALLKRSKYKDEPPARIIKVADLEINREQKSVVRSGQNIDLSAKEYMLLEFLASNRGRVVSRKELTEKVWDIHFNTGTNIVDVYINFLRKKMDSGFEKKLIHTRTGLGYILADEQE